MWSIATICSDPECAELDEFTVASLDEAETLVCECGCCLVILTVATFEPVYVNVA